MSKNIFDEALEKINIEFDAWERSEKIEAIEIIEEALELGKLYKELSFAWEERFDYTNGEQRIRDLQKQIKELENE